MPTYTRRKSGHEMTDILVRIPVPKETVMAVAKALRCSEAAALNRIRHEYSDSAREAMEQACQARESH